MTAGRTDTASGSAAPASPRPPVLTAPDLGRLRDGEADELTDADVESLLIEDCRLGFTNLAGTTVRDLLIRATRIDELDLSGVEAQRVRFEDCRVGTLRLSGGSLSDVDLRGLEMSVVDGVDSLGGTTISWEQLTELAPLMAARLGLRVEEGRELAPQSASTRQTGDRTHGTTDI